MYTWFPYKAPDLSECQYNTTSPQESVSTSEICG